MLNIPLLLTFQAAFRQIYRKFVGVVARRALRTGRYGPFEFPSSFVGSRSFVVSLNEMGATEAKMKKPKVDYTKAKL